MGGIYCTGYNLNYGCEVLDKNGRVVKGCSASDTRSITFGGYLNPCGTTYFGHSPTINVVVPISSTCSVSMRAQLPNKHYYCSVIPAGGGCRLSSDTYIFKQSNLK